MESLFYLGRTNTIQEIHGTRRYMVLKWLEWLSDSHNDQMHLLLLVVAAWMQSSKFNNPSTFIVFANRRERQWESGEDKGIRRQKILRGVALGVAGSSWWEDVTYRNDVIK